MMFTPYQRIDAEYSGIMPVYNRPSRIGIIEIGKKDVHDNRRARLSFINKNTGNNVDRYCCEVMANSKEPVSEIIKLLRLRFNRQRHMSNNPAYLVYSEGIIFKPFSLKQENVALTKVKAA